MGFEIDPDLIENDKLVLEEDVDGNLIYRHKSTNAEFVYHVGKSAWLPREGLDLDGGNVTNVGTLDVADASIDNIVYRQGTIGSITSHVGDRVTIDGDALETIFDVAGTVDVMSGTIVGPDVGRLVVTWDDATADDIYPDSKHFGEDNAGNLYSAHAVPPIKDASKLEIKNGGAGSGIFGYMVRTI